MAEAKSRADWALMSNLLALVASGFTFGKKAFNPKEFNPWEREKEPVEKIPLRSLKGLFPKQRKK
mgnify:CR=1 FL=1